jgi:4-alpha-glucanotransferase
MVNIGLPRACGLLLHPTSLPSPYGIGDLGPAAERFIDQLARVGGRFWQVLPLNPTGFGESPYQTLSAFVGNTNLISLERLRDDGYLTDADLSDAPLFPVHKVDYAAAIAYHDELLTLAYERFIRAATPAQRADFAAFCQAEAAWLEDWALFAALKEANGLQLWTYWPEGERRYAKDSRSLMAARWMHAARIGEHRWRQWVFFRQWEALRTYANTRQIAIIGDVPIFVAHDSVDVWANPDLFFLDSRGNPPLVTGVPPDSFNPDAGQRWGHPLYRWDQHANTGYAWWLARLKMAARLFDYLRIDHFRGFWDYFEIPAADATTTRYGRWMDGPRDSLFDAIPAEIKARIIAEDLGDNMSEVVEWRERLGLPGMAVLQFAFSGSEEELRRFSPAILNPQTVLYTGTHDNNTALGWWQLEADVQLRERVQQLAAQMAAEAEIPLPSDPVWQMILIGMCSPANALIVPLQDVIGLGASARMNRPGIPAGNWRWRYTEAEISAADWGLWQALAKAGRR